MHRFHQIPSVSVANARGLSEPWRQSLGYTPTSSLHIQVPCTSPGYSSGAACNSVGQRFCMLKVSGSNPGHLQEGHSLRSWYPCMDPSISRMADPWPFRMHSHAVKCRPQTSNWSKVETAQSSAWEDFELGSYTASEFEGDGGRTSGELWRVNASHCR